MKKVFALLLSVSLLAGCGQSYQAEKEFWKAEKVLSGIKKVDLKANGPQVFDPAIDAFKKVYEQYPSTGKAAESLFVISNLYIRQKKYDDALKTLEKIIQNFSSQGDRAPEARYGMAGIYEIQGDWKKAEALYWETSEYHPFNPKGLYAPIHIMLYYKKNSDKEGMELAYQKAMDFYKRMLKQTGPIQAASAIKNYIALAQLSKGQWKEARQTWDEIPKDFPNSGYAPLALLASGELSWKRQELEPAIKSYEEYLKKYPKHNLVKRTTVQLGMIYASKKEGSKARELFDSALEGEKNQDTIADIKILVGKSYQEEGNWPEAEKIYQSVQNDYKNTNAALQIPFIMASYYEDKGNKEEAKKVLDAAIDRYETLLQSSDPRVADYALRLQNTAYAEKGDWQKVLKNFDNRIEVEKSPLRKGNWVFLKAVVTERRLQDAQGALALYDKFLNEFPDHPYASLAKTRQSLLLKKA